MSRGAKGKEQSKAHPERVKGLQLARPVRQLASKHICIYAPFQPSQAQGMASAYTCDLSVVASAGSLYSSDSCGTMSI